MKKMNTQGGMNITSIRYSLEIKRMAIYLYGFYNLSADDVHCILKLFFPNLKQYPSTSTVYRWDRERRGTEKNKRIPKNKKKKEIIKKISICIELLSKANKLLGLILSSLDGEFNLFTSISNVVLNVNDVRKLSIKVEKELILSIGMLKQL